MNCLNKIYSQNTRIVHDGLMATMYPAGRNFSLVYDNDAKNPGVFDEETIQAAIANGAIDIVPESTTYEPVGFMSEKHIEREARRAAYLHDARKYKQHRNKKNLNKSIEITAKRIGDLSPPAWRTVYDWIVEDDRRGGDATLPEPNQRKRDKRISEEVDCMMRDAIDDHLSLDPNPRKSKAHDLFKKRYEQKYKIKIGDKHRSTFYNRCNEILNFEWIKRTQGAHAANRYMRCALGELKVHGILDLVQVDAVHPNIYLLDDEGRALGRPVIHVAIDVYSRAILGFSIEILKKESSAGVIECLKNSMMPKDEISYCDNPWPQYGKIHELATDGGKAYTAETVMSFLAFLKVTRQTAETRRPWAKAIIERFFWTLRAQCLSTFPGYIPRKDSEPVSDKALKQSAQMTLKAFEMRLTKYIVDFYHQNPHSALDGRTPDQMWHKSIAENRDPQPVSRMHTALMLKGEKYVRSLNLTKGITLKNGRYQSKELQMLHEEIRKKQRTGKIEVECLFDPSDISKITVIEKKLKRIIEVPAVNASLKKGMSLAEYDAIRSENDDVRAENEKNAESFSAYMHLLHEQGLEVDGSVSEIEPVEDKPTKLSQFKKQELDARIAAMDAGIDASFNNKTEQEKHSERDSSDSMGVYDALMGSDVEGLS